MERKGVEPSTSALRTQPLRVVSENQKGLAATGESGCSSGCCESVENELGESVRESFPNGADSFSAALAMIASLPLSDNEKAEAVRRLMAGQEGAKS